MKSVNKILAGAGVLVCAVSLTIGSTPLPAMAMIAHDKVVSANPADNTPQIVLGTSGETTLAFAQIGSTMYAGGRFLQVQNPARTITYPRQNFFSFNASTGEVSTLNLAFDGIVQTLVPGPDGKSLYIGGSFRKVNGVATQAIVKYDLVNDQLDPTFNAPTANGTVSNAKLVNGRLIVVGTLAKYLLALDPTTGADTGYLNFSITGASNPGDITKVRRFSTDPAGTMLVALGNFTAINGQARKQAFKVALGATATLTTWHVPRFDGMCTKNLNIAQAIDFSPDGSYFVIGTTGASSGINELCDAAARFEANSVSPTAEPTWINWTGGDSIYGIGITGAAVYVGGHPRWLDNPYGNNTKGPGAVDRVGIGAIDPVSGKANSWNPGKTRGHGVEAFYATPTGLWIGSDGQFFAGENHAGIAFCPKPK